MAHASRIARPLPQLSARQFVTSHPLTSFFFLAYIFMWIFALPMAISRNLGVGLLAYDLSEAVGNVLFLLATFSGPTLAALVVVGFTEGRAGIKRLFARAVQWRVGARWYAVVFSANLLIWLFAYSAVVGTQLLSAAITHWSLILTTFLPLVAFGIIIPSVAEEPGWRGFALPRLQERYGPLAGTLTLGLLHGLWHLPVLFTINFGPLPVGNLLPFILTAAFATVLYTWVYNHTGGSILIAMLFHASGNAVTGWLTALFNVSGIQQPDTGWGGYLATTGWLNVMAYGVAALLVIVMTRGRLGYKRIDA